MGKEIERKFLLKDDSWRSAAEPGVPFSQGYIRCGGAESATVRVRIAGTHAFLTIKSPVKGISRSEYEYEIPLNDAAEMLGTLCKDTVIEKIRYIVPFAGKTWEIDEFAGKNKGLIVAEVELADESEPFEKPSWLGREVSGQPRYFNSALCLHPYSEWTQD